MIRWRQRSHLVSIARVLEEEQLDLLSDLPQKQAPVSIAADCYASRSTYLCRTQSMTPISSQLGEHAKRSKFLVLPSSTVHRKLVVCHAL